LLLQLQQQQQKSSRQVDDGDDDNNKETFKFYCTFPVVGRRRLLGDRFRGSARFDNDNENNNADDNGNDNDGAFFSRLPLFADCGLWLPISPSPPPLFQHPLFGIVYLFCCQRFNHFCIG